jgi:hypothetical protein
MNPTEKSTEISYIEASTKDPNGVRVVSSDDLIFETDNKPNENPMSYFDLVTEWRLILFITSKSTELGVLEKIENDGFSIQTLDDTSRATLPLLNDNDTYPVGLGISFNTQNQIDLSKF